MGQGGRHRLNGQVRERSCSNAAGVAVTVLPCPMFSNTHLAQCNRLLPLSWYASPHLLRELVEDVVVGAVALLDQGPQLALLLRVEVLQRVNVRVTFIGGGAFGSGRGWVWGRSGWLQDVWSPLGNTHTLQGSSSTVAQARV